MMPAPNDGILTEEIVLRCSRQYDVDAVRFVVLHGLRLRKLGDGFAKCSAIVRLDISRNNLTSLSGIEPTAGSLQYLNAAENLITDVSAVKECKLLEVVMLEGNRIGSEAALRPLAQLPELRQLVLKREVALEDADETLELDNPVCEKGGYEEIIRRYFSSVMFVDGCYMLNEATSDVVTSVFKPLPPLDTLKAPQDSNAKADVEERLFVNVVAECAEACRKALALRFCKRGPEDFKVGVPDNAVRSEGRITLGDYVMITGGGMKRIVHVQAGGKLRLGSSGSVQLDKLAGVRFGEVVYYDPRSRVFVPTNDYPDLDITTLEEHIEDGRDNRHLVDENKSQVLSNEEIAEMRREKGVDVFLNTLVEKSATFHAKTAYSQEKYLRKKKKRYGVLYKIERVTPDGVAETYLPTINPTDVEPESRVLRLRADTLALILHHSDVHSGSRVIVYDKTNGHLEAALLTRLGSDGIIFQIMDRTAQPNMFPSQTMGIENVRELWKAVPRNAAFLRGEEDTENEEKATEKVNKRGKEGGSEVSQWLRGIDARRMLQERPADSLIIVDDEDDAPAALDDLLPFVALNGHIVVHSPFLEDLTALFTKLRGECVNICISEVWCRHHQVLPNRTHPTVRMSTASGYLLTAIKVNESTINCSGAGAPQSPIEEVTPSVPAEVPAVDGRLSRKHPRAQENGEQEGNLSDS